MSIRGSRRAKLATAAATVGLVTAFCATGVANASIGQAASGRRVPVPEGMSISKIPGAQPGATIPPNTPETVSFILKARNLPQLESKVTHGWTGHYLSVPKFASAYGQTPAAVKALSKWLGKYGIRTTPYADNLDVTAYGTAGEFNRALQFGGLRDYYIPRRGAARAQHVYAPVHGMTVPAPIAKTILSILGLNNYAPFASTAIRSVKQPGSRVQGNQASPIPPGMRVPADFVNRYGLRKLTHAGHQGQGATIGIVTLASLDPSVPVTFWQDLGLPAYPSIYLDNVDGGSGPVSLTSGSDETTLDVEQSGAIAPYSRVTVYQAPNTDAGFVDGYFTAAAQNIAGSVSASWGESETEVKVSVANGTESPTYLASFDEAFLESAAQGQSTFASSGDYGAYTAKEDVGSTNLSVGTPASSPYITAAGGTTLPGKQTYPVVNSSGQQTGSESVVIPHERAWSWDYLWPMYKALGYPTEAAAAKAEAIGSTGGYSVYYREPAYQKGVAGVQRFSTFKYLTPTDYNSSQGPVLPFDWRFNPDPKVGSGSNTVGRGAPDISYDADPQTGYALYDPQFIPVYGTPFEMFGGTSFVAPQLNGSTAVMESALGHRLGFWNPTIYGAATSRKSPFNPMANHTVYRHNFTQTNSAGQTSPLPGVFNNNNLYYSGTPKTVYDPATGLGIADLSALSTFFKSR